jgi:hypothetical protein
LVEGKDYENEDTQGNGNESETEIAGPELAHVHMQNSGSRRMWSVAHA